MAETKTTSTRKPATPKAPATPVPHVFRTKAQRDKSKKEQPIPFEIYDEVFYAKPRIQTMQIIDFMARDSEDQNIVQLANDVLMPFFEAALLPESYERFHALLRSDDKFVEMEDIVEVLQWLVGEYTNRPTAGS